LGRDLIAVLDGHELYSFDLDWDITDAAAVAKDCAAIKPDLIINSAAYTDVDGCETNVDLAYRVNAIGPHNLALAARAGGIPLVSVSTDFVFDGTKTTPYDEFDTPRPMSVYGRSKLAGENLVREVCPEHYIIRTAWLYSRHGHNFVKTMLKLAGERDTLTVVDDQIGSPTFSLDLATRIAELISTGWYGTYHVTNSGQTSWYGFARAILEQAGLDPEKVKPMTSAELDRPAPRPAFSVLANYAADLRGLAPMRDWREALAAYFEAGK
jgi:dTDP-4-dehydrorhamnose reductase